MKKRSLLIPSAFAALLLAGCDIMPPDFSGYSYPTESSTTTSQAKSAESSKAESSKAAESSQASSQASSAAATSDATSQAAPEETETISTKYGLRNKGTGKFVCALEPSADKDMQGRDQASALAVSFKAGTEFQLYDTENKAGWIVYVDPYSFGGAGDASKAAEYITAGTDSWTVVKDFTADVYAKFKMGDDQIYFGLK